MMLILGIILFALLVVIHEFGHFIVARRNGVEVEEFGIGFPPRIYGKKVGETLYSVNLIPLGGFVKQKGESDSDQRPGSFGSTSLWVKAKILLAGVGMNFIAAFVILLILALTQLPTLVPGQYQVPADQTVTSEGVMAVQVVEGSAAAQAGITSGDRIISIENHTIDSSQHLRSLTERFRGEEVAVTYESDSEKVTTPIALTEDEDGGNLGVAPLDAQTSRYTWAAPLVALGVTGQITGLILVAIWNIITGLITGAGSAAAEGVAGPVGIVMILQNIGNFGISYLFSLIANISIALAVFNVLPIPALDGGRLAVIGGARILRKPLPEKIENSIHAIGFVAILALLVFVTYVDIQRFF